MKETWKDIVGYEGTYQVSNLGNVRSLPRLTKQKGNGGNYHHQTRKGTLLKPQKNSKGYFRVYVGKMMFVHRLVALHFVPNPYNLPVVNHLDADKLNNEASNLEWTTHKGNSEHAKQLNLFDSIPKGESNKFAKLTEEEVLWIRENAIVGDKKFGQKPLARKFGVSPTTIAAIISRKKWKHI